MNSEPMVLSNPPYKSATFSGLSLSNAPFDRIRILQADLDRRIGRHPDAQSNLSGNCAGSVSSDQSLVKNRLLKIQALEVCDERGLGRGHVAPVSVGVAVFGTGVRETSKLSKKVPAWVVVLKYALESAALARGYMSNLCSTLVIQPLRTGGARTRGQGLFQVFGEPCWQGEPPETWTVLVESIRCQEDVR